MPESTNNQNRIGKKSDLHERLAKIFNKAQKTASTHSLLIEKLKDIFKEYHGPDDTELDEEYLSTFLEMMKPILLTPIPPKAKIVLDPKAPSRTPIERLISCLAQFVCSISAEFCFEIISRLLDWHTAKEERIRFSVIAITSKLLASVGKNVVDLPDETWEKLSEVCLSRMQDKKYTVRAQACAYAHRLQAPREENDPFVNTYCQLITSDRNGFVRKVAVTNVGLCNKSIPILLKCSQDKSEEVREAVFERLSRSSQKLVTPAQLIQTLVAGLKDTSKRVNRAALKLLTRYFKKRMHGDTVDGFEFAKVLCPSVLDPEMTEQAEFVLKHLFAEVIRSDKIPDIHISQCITNDPNRKFRPINAFYWRCLLDFYYAEEKVEEMDEILCDFSEIISNVTTTRDLEAQFRNTELLKIALHMNFTDETVCQRMKAFTVNMLTTYQNPKLYVEELIRLLHMVSKQPNEFTDAVLESVDHCTHHAKYSEGLIQSEEQRKQKIAQLKGLWAEKRQHLKRCIAEKKEIEEKISSEEQKMDQGNDQSSGENDQGRRKSRRRVNDDEEYDSDGDIEMVSSSKSSEKPKKSSVKPKKSRKSVSFIDGTIPGKSKKRKKSPRKRSKSPRKKSPRKRSKSPKPPKPSGPLYEQLKENDALIKRLLQDIKVLKGDIDDCSVENLQTAVDATHLRALLMISSFLKYAVEGVENLLYLVETMFIPLLENRNHDIKCWAVRCLGQFCATKPSLAKDHISTLQSILDTEEHVDVLAETLKSAIDILLIRKMDFIEDDNERAEKEGYLVRGWTEFFESENSRLQKLSIEGSCKVLLAGNISLNWKVDNLSRLLDLYWSVDNDEIKQMLAVFFPNFCTKAQNMELLCQVFVPTIRRRLNPSTNTMTDGENDAIKDIKGMENDAINAIKSMFIQFPHWIQPKIISDHNDLAQLKLHENLLIQLLMEFMDQSESEEQQVGWAELLRFAETGAVLYRDNVYELCIIHYLLSTTMTSETVTSPKLVKQIKKIQKNLKKIAEEDDLSLEEEQKERVQAEMTRLAQDKKDFLLAIYEDHERSDFNLCLHINEDQQDGLEMRHFHIVPYDD